MLINKKYLAKYSILPLPSNYNYDEIMLYVPISEQIWIRPILGDAFYEELTYQVEHNNVSEENATLFTEGGLYQYLSYATCLEGLAFLWVHASEVGLVKGHSDNSDSITQKELVYLESHLRRQVEFLKDNLIKWLDSHCESFPLYHPTNCGCNSCGNKGLNMPQPNWSIYSPKKKHTELL